MTYDRSWDCPHVPGPQKQWQESDCYWFFDARRGVGGFHRIGQRPATGVGQATLFVFKEGGSRFVLSGGKSASIPLADDSRQETKQVVGAHTAESLGNGRMRFTWNEPGCSGDVEFYESFHEPRNWSRTGHSDNFMSNINSDGHLECSGRLRGRVMIGDDAIDIDALCHRDRSWGFRDNGRVSMHRYRMFSGTVGAELSFASFLLDLKDGTPMVAGFVSRGGEEKDVRKLRVLTTFDADGLTPLSSTGILTMEDGEELRIEARSVQGFMTPVPEAGAGVQDNISVFTWQGKTGFLDLELCTNPGRGTYIPRQSDVTYLAVNQGISATVKYQL